MGEASNGKVPQSVKYAIIGAGIHGLSTAFHLAQMLKKTGRGSGEDILVVDKTAIAAGASGIACGVVRNNYFQPAMRELMAHSVDVWESDPKTYAYHPVGYMQISPECMHEDVASIYEQQKAIGYESVFIEGAADCQRIYEGPVRRLAGERHHLGAAREDAAATPTTRQACYGLAAKAEAEGVRILTGVEVMGFEFGSNSGAVTALNTNQGRIACDDVVVGAGPWVTSSGTCSSCRRRSRSRAATARCMTTCRCGTSGASRRARSASIRRCTRPMTAACRRSSMSIPTRRSIRIVDGTLITDRLWGIYYKPDFNFGGVQGGSSPYKVDQDPDSVAVDPYGPDSPDFVVGDNFIRYVVLDAGALPEALRRQDARSTNTEEKSGGLGCFTPDNFPVFDVFRENVYVIADSNHGYKMLGVGKLVAQEIMGEKSALLEPFRFARFEKGELHPTSHSPFPWS